MKNNIKKIIFSTILIIICLLNINITKKYINIDSSVSLTDGVIVDIAAGTDHNLALDQQGNLWAWGRNDHGQVGNGTTIDQLTPVQIMRGHKFKKISAGNGFSAAIDTNGYLYGWGNDYNPNKIECYIPTLVSDTILYKDVHCSYDSTQTVKINEDMKYFGYTYYYYYRWQSMNIYEYYTEYAHDDRHPKIVSNTKYKAFENYTSYKSSAYKEFQINNNIVSADGNYFMYYYGSSSNSSDFCMFYQYEFIVDDLGKVNIRFSEGKMDNVYHCPTQIVPYIFFPNIDLSTLDDKFITSVSVRKIMDYSTTGNSFAFFLDDCGTAYFVGYNGVHNYCGNSDYISNEMITTPVEVQTNAKFTKVSAGQNHALALDDNGKVYSWGNNAYGQLGHDDTSVRTTPTMIKTFDETKSFNFNAFSNEDYSDLFYQYGGSDYTVVEDGSKGTLNVNSDTGEFTYTPNANEYGNDTAVISISYNGVVVNYQVNVYIDRKPVFTGGTNSFNVECGQSFSGNAPSTDPDNHNLAYSIIKQPLKGSVVLNNNAGSFTYTAGDDLAGNDTFTIGVSDGYCIVEYPVSVHIQSLITYDDETTINIDLLNENTYSSNVNAKDIDGDTLSYSISKLPLKGNITVDNNGNYIYTADGDKYGEDSFTISIDDGYKPLEVTYTVNLYAVKDNGTLLNKTITKGTSYTDVIKTDAKGAIPIYTIKTQPNNGNVMIDSSTGEYTYTPNIGSIGDDSFVVLVDYIYGQYELTIHIYQNTIPDDSNVRLSIVTNENQNYTGNVKCNDIDNDSLLYTIKTQPSKGSITINPTTGEYTYYPNNNVAGDDSFEVFVNDGTDTITILVSVHIESLITTNNVIDKVISQNITLTDQIIANDKDGDSLTYSIYEYPTNGVCNIDSTTGEYTFIPNNDFYGNEKFIIKIDDGVYPVFVEVSVFVNRRPNSDQILINLETKNNSVTGNISCVDPDGDTLFYSLDSQPLQGSVIINSSTGLFAYTPYLNAAGDDTFTIKVSDGCDYIFIKVIVHNETELEIDLSNSNLVVNQGKNTQGQVNAIDLDGDSLNYSILDIPSQGTLNLNENTGSWTYNANSNAAGNDSFTIEVTDGKSKKTITYNLSVNTPAEFNNLDNTNISTNENENYNGQINATDLDGDSLTYIVVSQGLKGNITIDPLSGRFIYVPNNNEAGNDSFILGVNDGNFVSEIIFNVHIESDINIVNSTITSTVSKDDIVIGNIKVNDKDGDILSYSIYQQGEKGNANVTNDGNWSYFSNNTAGDDSFVISVSDGIHTKYITIYIHISTSPIFEENNITISVSDGSSTSGKVRGNDEDGDSLQYSIQYQPINGTVKLNSLTGEYVYTSFTNIDATEDSFVVSVTDGNNFAYVTVRVIINNAPEVNDYIIDVKQGGNYNGTITVNDPENDAIEFSISIQGSKGTASINSTTGEFIYNFNEKLNTLNDSFVVKVSDGFNTKYVVVKVNNINNNAPEYSDYEIIISQGGNGKGKIEGTDYEDDTINFEIYQQGVGHASINSSTGEFEYNINDISFVGIDSFTILVSDGYNEKIVTVKVEVLKNERPNGKGGEYSLKSDSSITGEIKVSDIENNKLTYSIEYQGNKGIATIDENSGEFKYTAYKDTSGYDCFVVSITDGFNKVSYLVEINIDFVDSNNSWAIPTTIAMGSVTTISIASLIITLLKKKKIVK